MTKKEIVKTISEEIGLTQLKTKEIVQKTFDAIVNALVDEKRIELRNFGVFEVKKRAAAKHATLGPGSGSTYQRSTWSRSNPARRWKTVCGNWSVRRRREPRRPWRWVGLLPQRWCTVRPRQEPRSGLGRVRLEAVREADGLVRVSQRDCERMFSARDLSRRKRCILFRED